jgi:hypothetical protein
MNEKEVLDAALEALSVVSKVAPASAERLEAMSSITSQLPWDNIATMSIGWEKVTLDGDDEIFPTLHVVMRGELP